MADSPLIAFWIVPPGERGPFYAFGVTAFSLNDAFRIIEDAGYALPEDKSTLHVKDGITISDLDQSHIAPNIGPLIVRGLWYPFTKVGM